MIRRATVNDIESIKALLNQVNKIHHEGRPDLFKRARKYSDEELVCVLADDHRPVFVYEDDDHRVLGYAFLQFQQKKHDVMVTDIKTLYIDDICVDEQARGKHIGTLLYDFVLSYAKEQGCYNVTLHAWSCNPDAVAFYEAMGMKVQMYQMEQIL